MTTNDKPRRRQRRRSVAVTPEGSEALATDGVAARRRRRADPTQDMATYTCSCGLVFEAHVQTSVDCPHCGGQQAW